jgi:hypothetical protein
MCPRLRDCCTELFAPADGLLRVPPHFHAKYGDFEAVITIDSGEIVEGRLPPRVLGLVQEWREYHRTELAEDWNLARERKALKRIKPLE